MKKLGLLVLFLGFFAFSFGQGVIDQTGHGFNSLDAWSSLTTNHTCGPCHTPHNAYSSTGVPLWSHTTTDGTAFTVYSGNGSTLDATVNDPAGVSLQCLSCHDGTLALDDHIGGLGTGGVISGTADLGTDLSSDHPISFTYNTLLSTTDGGLFDPAVALSGLGSTIDADLLIGGSMECSSCHDPHGVDDGGGTPEPMLMRINNDDSALCLTCHNK